MWKKMAGRLFELQSRNGILEEKDRRLYEYAYGVLLGRVVIYLIIVILGIITGNWMEMMKLCFLVMQDVNHQLFTESVEEEIVLGMSKANGDENKQKADAIMKSMDLEGLAEIHPLSLSGGQKQRVAIGSAISSDKEILVFDEPTSGLDSTMLGGVPIGAWLYMKGQISLPIYIACIVIPIGFIGPMMKLSASSEQLTTIAANLKPIKAFLDISEQQRPEQQVQLDGSAYTFENVSFWYEKGTEVLHDISFYVKPETMTAIVGPSGSGKSTIAKLMAGFWDASVGVIRYGGVDIKNIPFDQMMQEISYVAQDNFLFNKSIKENIRMGNPTASDEAVIKAARAANCHDFIMQLPQGYDTSVGDAGDRLSGGERQRITIARAMLKSSSVIILDEATAYADPQSEAQIQQAVNRLVHGKTLIVIAHRLSTIQNADQIMVVERGRIVATGTQKELLENSPLYRSMWEKHLGAVDCAGKDGEVIC